MSRAFPYTLLCLVLSGCGVQSFQVKAKEPAVVNMTKYRLIVVDDLMGGRGGRKVADELAEAFSRAVHNLSGEKLFELLERERLDRVLQELGRQRGDVWSSSTVSKLGQLVGAGVLIHGRVAEYGVQENLEVDGDAGSRVSKRRKAVARVQVTLFASDTKTGDLIDRVELEQDVSAQTRLSTAGSGSAQPAPIDHETLLLKARRNIVDSYLARVIPDDVVLNVRLYTHDKFPELRKGNSHAASGKWQLASASYREALERMGGQFDEYRYLALYNLGVSLNFENRFDEAEAALQEAYSLQPEGFIKAQLDHVERRREKYQRIVDMEHGDD